MTYSKAIQKYEEKSVQVRTNYACKAYGCPNAGSMEGDVCYFHWRQTDSTKWHEVTQSIRENFDQKRNWGEFSAERQEKHRAYSQSLFPDMLSDRPTGVKHGAA